MKRISLFSALAPAFRRRLLLLLSGAGLFAFLALALAYSGPERTVAAHNADAPAASTVAVKPRPQKTQVTLNGFIAASRLTPVLAPFDGMLRERKVTVGDKVTQGAELAVMDAADLEARLREAQIAVLKTSMMMESLHSWDSSQDVLRARRSVEAAEVNAVKSERQVKETKALLDKGIVSRNEYEGLVQQQEATRLALAGAKLDLQAALKKGDETNRKVVELELANARDRVNELARQRENIIIRSPTVGVVTRPPSPTTATTALPTPDQGGRLSRGQAVMAIAETSTLHVIGKVDEVDVNLLRAGQSAKITNDAFGRAVLEGTVISISAEADTSAGNSNRMPFFEVKVAFKIDDGVLQDKVKLGMSARMTIDVAHNDKAIIVPIEAIHKDATGIYVFVKSDADAPPQRKTVILGRTTTDGVEIVSGLSPGEKIMVPNSR